MNARINKIAVLFVVVSSFLLAGCGEQKVPSEITVAKQTFNICFAMHPSHVQDWYTKGEDGKFVFPQIDMPGCQDIFKVAVAGGNVYTKDTNDVVTLTVKNGQNNTVGNVAP